MILFGTLGFTAPKLLPSIRKRGPEAVVLFYDKHEKSDAARAEIAKYCESINLPVKAYKLDAFDLLEDAVRIREELRKHPRDQVVFSLTGGTTILSSAALLACVLEGVRCFYLRPDSEEEIPLPLLRLEYGKILNEEKRRILHAIQKFPGGCTQMDIKRSTGLSKPNVNHHVGNLEDLGLVEVLPDPKDRRKKTLKLAPSTRLLLMEGEG
jgi:CRISPR locus-related DNA-binding protein